MSDLPPVITSLEHLGEIMDCLVATSDYIGKVMAATHHDAQKKKTLARMKAGIEDAAIIIHTLAVQAGAPPPAAAEEGTA
jgi:hypothetical protein